MTETDDLMCGLKNYGGVLLSPKIYEAITATEEGRQCLSEMQEAAKLVEKRRLRTDQVGIELLKDLLKIMD